MVNGFREGVPIPAIIGLCDGQCCQSITYSCDYIIIKTTVFITA